MSQDACLLEGQCYVSCDALMGKKKQFQGVQGQAGNKAKPSFG